MRSNLRAASLLVLAPVVLGACATKGFVRKSVASQAAITDSMFVAERAARAAGDSANSAQIAALRGDLEAMRKDFGAKIAQVEEGIRFAMPVNFAFDDATVTDTNKPLLTRFASVAQKYYPGATITVEGFTDPAGSTSYNNALSRRRAESVREFLTTQGLDGSTLRVIGYGESRQVVQGAKKDDAGAEQNRRVVFVIETAGNVPSGVAMVGQ